MAEPTTTAAPTTAATADLSQLLASTRASHQENLIAQFETAAMEREQLAQTTLLNFLKTGFQAMRNISDNMSRAV